MALSDSALERLARHAYEWSRLRSALAAGAFIPPVAALGLVQCEAPSLTVGCIVLLTLAVVAFHHAGRDFARGSRAGLVAGLAPFLMPIAVHVTGVYCAAPVLCASLPAVCLAGGVVSGLVLGHRGRRPPGASASTAFWVAALTVTLAAGAVGCLLAGVAGLAGLAAGLVVGSAPALLARSV